MDSKPDLDARLTGIDQASGTETTVRRQLGGFTFDSRGLNELHGDFMRAFMEHYTGDSSLKNEAAILEHAYLDGRAVELWEHYQVFAERIESKRKTIERQEQRLKEDGTILNATDLSSLEQQLKNNKTQLAEMEDEITSIVKYISNSFAFAWLRVQEYPSRIKANMEKAKQYFIITETARKSGKEEVAKKTEKDVKESLEATLTLRKELNHWREQMAGIHERAMTLILTPIPNSSYPTQQRLTDVVEDTLHLLHQIGNKNYKHLYDPTTSAHIAYQLMRLLSEPLFLSPQQRIARAIEKMPEEMFTSVYGTFINTLAQLPSLLHEVQERRIEAKHYAEESGTHLMTAEDRRELDKRRQAITIAQAGLIPSLPLNGGIDEIFETASSGVEVSAKEFMDSPYTGAIALGIASIQYLADAEKDTCSSDVINLFRELAVFENDQPEETLAETANYYKEQRTRVIETARERFSKDREDSKHPSDINLILRVRGLTTNPHIKDLYLRDIVHIAKENEHYRAAYFLSVERLRTASEIQTDINNYLNTKRLDFIKKPEDVVAHHYTERRFTHFKSVEANTKTYLNDVRKDMAYILKSIERKYGSNLLTSAPQRPGENPYTPLHRLAGLSEHEARSIEAYL